MISRIQRPTYIIITTAKETNGQRNLHTSDVDSKKAIDKVPHMYVQTYNRYNITFAAVFQPFLKK